MKWRKYFLFFFFFNFLFRIEVESIRAFLVAQTVKNVPAVQETQVWSPVQEDPLERGSATYSSILAWRVPWTEDPTEKPLAPIRVTNRYITFLFIWRNFSSLKRAKEGQKEKGDPKMIYCCHCYPFQWWLHGYHDFAKKFLTAVFLWFVLCFSLRFCLSINV